jgi:hypothetical protein
MSNESDKRNESGEGTGEYNPSGGVPGHPADPQTEANNEDEDEGSDEDAGS